MYHQYFGLSEPAFSIAVNPRYLYMSRQHKEALAHLLYGVQGGGFVLLTGEVGTGKTTIIRSLLEQLPDNTDIAMVFNPMANVPEMLGMICDELKIAYDKDHPSVKNLTDSLHHFLLENHARGRNTVLLIDEAQLLSPEALEQIRLLTNLETNTQKLLQIILVGQPELNQLLSQPRLRQLAQRITARFHLAPLSLAETRAYINHRLQVAGLSAERSPFSAGIIKKIHRLSGGIPRRINILCERLLVGLYGHNKQQVDRHIFALAKQEVGGNLEKNERTGILPGVWLAIILGLAILVIMYLWFVSSAFRSASAPDTSVATQSSSATAPVKQTESATDSQAYRLDKRQAAQKLLFDYLGVNTEEDLFPCWGENPQLQCETDNLQQWEDVLALNRPMILTLVTPHKFTVYAVLVGVRGDMATLLTEDGDSESVPLADLGPHWNGRVFYAWRRPPGYSGPVGQGDRGPVVRWLAEQFALLDKQRDPLTRDVYNRALAERVRIFQQHMGLRDDGIAGQQTIFKLNEVMGLDKTLRSTPVSPAADNTGGGGE